MSGVSRTIVDFKQTAKDMGSGSLNVFATPAMIALMENAACLAIKDSLGEEETSVGIEINVKHTAPTAVGEPVEAIATVTKQEGKIFTFEIECFSGETKIGSAIHKRCIVNSVKFMSKLEK